MCKGYASYIDFYKFNYIVIQFIVYTKGRRQKKPISYGPVRKRRVGGNPLAVTKIGFFLKKRKRCRMF